MRIPTAILRMFQARDRDEATEFESPDRKALLESRARSRDFVRDQIDPDGAWRVRVGTGAWICPYCLGAVGVHEKTLARLAAIEVHLAAVCGPFRAGWAPTPRRSRRHPIAGDPRGAAPPRGRVVEGEIESMCRYLGFQL